MNSAIPVNDIDEAIRVLSELPFSVDSILLFYRWKHAVAPKIGLFSTAHGGDVINHFLLALRGELVWPETTIIDGQKVTLEYEANFNAFVRFVKARLRS
jgi:hypothetical protein